MATDLSEDCFHNYEKIGIVSDKRYVDQEYKRIALDDYFIQLAHLVAKRSHDSNTQHGCVIVRPDNSIATTGFNGFPAGSPDNKIPNTRKDGFKYLFINHAESSAIFHCAKNGIAISDCRIYLTGLPCHNCARNLVSVGIKEWHVGNVSHIHSEQEIIARNFWIDTFKVKVFCH